MNTKLHIIFFIPLTSMALSCANINQGQPGLCILQKTLCFPESGSKPPSFPKLKRKKEWKFQRKLNINNSGLNTALLNFPLLVKLDGTRIDYDAAGPNGKAMIFENQAQESELDFEIEEWNPGGDSYIWVKVPRINDSSQESFIILYYGHQNPPTPIGTGNPWTDDFAAVWHFSETANLDRKDSSGNDYHVNPQNFDGDEQVPAAIGNGLEMGGSNDHLSLNQSLGPYAQLTIEVFVLRHNNTSEDAILSTNGWDPQSLFFQFNTGDDLKFGSNSNYPAAATSNFSGVNTASWHYVVMVYDANAKTTSFYLDGALVKTSALSAAVELILPAARIGGWADPFSAGSRYFKGKLDEMRLSSVARSGEWIKTQHLSMADSLLSFGAAMD